ncbi:MAG: alcohol dehydrogenase catalytic domain-containing protein, partial [Acidimicrobiales bacterium]
MSSSEKSATTGNDGRAQALYRRHGWPYFRPDACRDGDDRGRCPACAGGRDNLCPLQLTTAMGMGGQAGGWAERVVVPAESCHVLP